LHVHNKTALGERILTLLEGEREQQQGAIQAKLKAGMMDAVLTLFNQRLRMKENTNQPEEFRYYRAVELVSCAIYLNALSQKMAALSVTLSGN
jgi:hypothetical protein